MQWSGVGGVLALVGLAACGAAPGESDLTLFYEFAGRRCDAAGAARIQVDVQGVDVDDGQAHEVGCADHPDGITAYGLGVGTYRVTVTGLGPQGQPRYGGEVGSVSVQPRTVNSVALAVAGHDLGALEVQWSPAACAQAEEVHLQALDPDGHLFADEAVPCATGRVRWDAVLPGVWRVGVAPSAPAGAQAAAVVYSVTVPSGGQGEITVPIARDAPAA